MYIKLYKAPNLILFSSYLPLIYIVFTTYLYRGKHSLSELSSVIEIGDKLIGILFIVY